jgi:hypothetical protein
MSTNYRFYLELELDFLREPLCNSVASVVSIRRAKSHSCD